MGRLILITENQTLRDEAEQFMARTLSDWPDVAGKPVYLVISLEELKEHHQTLTQGVAWLWFETADKSSLFEVLGTVQDQHVPCMITLSEGEETHGEMFDDGIVICRTDVPLRDFQVMVQTLFCQYQMIDGMRREMRVLHAHQGGLADQIGKMDEELRLASQLQKEFLPRKLPSLNDISFEVLWRPAGYVSGDIYDVVRLDENHIGFFVADAVGHGVPAALMTMYIKRSLQTKKILPGSEPGYRILEPSEAIAKLNHDMIERQAGKVRFATACYGLLNCKTRTLKIARAGHPYPMILKGNGTTEMIEPEGGLLGVFPDEEFEQAEVTLDAGDRMLLYSDGFEVAFPELSKGNKDGRLANEQYLEEFKMLSEGTLEEVFDRFASKLDQQAGSLNQRDDLTVVCLAVSESDSGEDAVTDTAPASAA
ncbi:PP2C family protein-serine/threonine phosphatase [Poriferisphaera sp. WC338]|uniref:PP2C family protein-serine/threonine phosphatase n=1 Tax=Poriferisphaera sp. WC338 TaxID=3425129 RepID=UPI003D81569E